MKNETETPISSIMNTCTCTHKRACPQIKYAHSTNTTHFSTYHQILEYKQEKYDNIMMNKM